MKPPIAVLGASGFVGSRLLERFHLTQYCPVRPVVRGYTSLARLARFDLDWRVADACSVSELSSAFKGCDTVVNLLVANPDIIVANALASYQAAEEAGVRRMIFMSSASVHGLVPEEGTNENSSLHTHHRFAYNNAKVRAERALFKLRESGSVELVVLRPSIVFGPRSRWLTDVADQLLLGTSYLINNGSGICNAIYVDNLVDAVQLSIDSSSADGEVFLLNNSERITWFDFYKVIAEALGIDIDSIHRLEPLPLNHSLQRTLKNLHGTKVVQGALPLVPSPLKQVVKGSIKALRDPGPQSPWILPPNPSLDVSEEISQLQLCTVHLPFLKAREILGYECHVSFSEGMRRSLAWLSFAGYPIHSSSL